jgi:hypothetical protein
LQACSFRIYFTLLFGVLFTFPSRYWYTIGLRGVFSLAGWCRRIRRGFHRPPPTQGYPPDACRLGVRGFHALWRRLPAPSPGYMHPTAALQPRTRLDACGLGSSAFARHYTRNHYCLLLLGVLRCFSSPGLLGLRRAATAGGRLSRSGTPRSKALSASRGLFAALRALPSLPKPRHPLHALSTALAMPLARRTLARADCLIFPYYHHAAQFLARPACQRTSPHLCGACGEYRSRTDGLLRARQAL